MWNEHRLLLYAALIGIAGGFRFAIEPGHPFFRGAAKLSEYFSIKLLANFVIFISGARKLSAKNLEIHCLSPGRQARQGQRFSLPLRLCERLFRVCRAELFLGRYFPVKNS
jgi:hypothetical protein